MKCEYRVLVWGTGVRATELMQRGVNASVIGFIDYAKRSDFFWELPVYEADNFPAEYDYILVATEYTDQIREICKSEKIDLANVVFLYAGAESEFSADPAIEKILGT